MTDDLTHIIQKPYNNRRKSEMTPIRAGRILPTAIAVLERYNLKWTPLGTLIQSSCFITTVILYSVQP